MYLTTIYQPTWDPCCVPFYPVESQNSSKPPRKIDTSRQHKFTFALLPFCFVFFLRLVNDTFCCYFSILQEKVFPFYETHSTGQDGYQKCCTENFATSLFGSSKYLAKDLMKIYPRTFFLFFLLKLRAENIIFRVAQVLTTGKGLWHLFLVEWGRIPTEKNSQDEGGGGGGATSYIKLCKWDFEQLLGQLAKS